MAKEKKGSKKKGHSAPITLSPIAVNDMPFEVVTLSAGASLGSPSLGLVEGPVEAEWHTINNHPTPRASHAILLSPVMTSPPRPPPRDEIASPVSDYPRSRCLSLARSEVGPKYVEPYRGSSISPARAPSQDSLPAQRSRPPSPHSELSIGPAPSRAQSPCYQRSHSPPGRYTSPHPRSPSPSPPANQFFVHQHIEKPRHEAMRLVREFSTALSQELHGWPSPSTTKGLMPSIHAEYRNFAKELFGTAPQFCPWQSSDGVDETALIGSLQADDDAVCLGSINTLYLNDVADLAQQCRIGELEDGYPKAAKTHLVQASTDKWKGIAEKCLDVVERTILQRVEILATEHFGVYQRLKAKAIQSVTSIISEIAEVTRRLIDQSHRCESSIYTLNMKDLQDYRARSLRLYQDVHRQSLGQGGVISALNNHTPSVRPSKSSDVQKWKHINDAIASLSALGISGVTAEALTRVIPPSESNAELEVMAEVRAYFEIAYKRFGDNVPNQINTSFIEGIKDGLDGALTSMVLDVTEEDCRGWFECA